MILKLDSEICIQDLKKDLICKINKGYLKNNYSFESNLIFKIIHENSNYEEYQWQLYLHDSDVVEKEIKSLLIDISKLDNDLVWDCMSIFSRYKRIIKNRNKIANKYLRS
ncbi:hypothetical protein M9B41_06915 [SAR86 cluster bacterium]|nr:hypothetical protein M9B41_06915 [SAR86 cluster bacterium]